LLIALNFVAEPTSMHLEAGEILLSTQLDRKGENISGALELRGNEGVIVRLR
jgi:alpha-glucosidase